MLCDGGTHFMYHHASGYLYLLSAASVWYLYHPNDGTPSWRRRTLIPAIWHVLSWGNLSYYVYSNYLSLFGKKQQTMRALHYSKLLSWEIASLTCLSLTGGHLLMVEDDSFTTWICSFTLVTLFSQRPTVQSSSRQKCEETFKEEKMAININNSKLVLSIDLGTSVATEAYVGFSCHYMADDCDMQSIGPTTMPLQDRWKNPGSSSPCCISHTL